MLLIRRSGARFAACCSACVVGLVYLTGSIQAAQPKDLYGATVAVSGSSQKALNAAFDSALAQVLVKVTGRAEAGNSLRRELFPDSRRILQQYRQLPNQRIYAAFDSAAIRQTLDAAGQPVWGENRPLVSIWLAVDAGSGQRYLLSDGSQDSGGRLGVLRQNLLGAASRRGLPVVLPLLDAKDLQQIGFADVWGGFQDRVDTVARRYGSNALLMGRATSMSPDNRNVRWTLAYAGQQSTWQGSVAAGPAKAADLLAQQFSITAGSADRVRLLVSGVNSIAVYARLRKYLRDIDMVKSATVVQVQADQIEFDMAVSGDVNRLSRLLRSSALLSAVAEPSTGMAANAADLHYRWAAAP